MDFATVFSRGNKIAAFICVLIVVTGFGASFVLNRLSASADRIRVDQLTLAEFKAQLNLAPGTIDSLKLNSGPLSEQAGSKHLDALQGISLPDSIAFDRKWLYKFTESSRREIKAISVQRFNDAAQIRQDETLPAFKAVTLQIQQENEKLNNQAGQFRRRSQVIKDSTFTVAGFLILGIVLMFYRWGISSTQKELIRHSQEISGLRFAALVQSSTDVILLTSRKGLVTLVNEACRKAWDVTPQSCVGKHVNNLFQSNDASNLTVAFEDALSKPNSTIETSMRIEVRPEVTHYFQVHIQNLMSNVHIGGMVITFHDITERAAVEEALTHQASHDRLTGLPNRSLVMIRLADALKKARASDYGVSALFIDLDNFKTINDTLGHEMGDLLLVNVAKRIQNTVRPSDTAARLGGDEFVVVLENVNGPETAETIAKRIVEQLSEPFQLGDEDVFVSASIGVATSQEMDEEPNDLLRKADLAMYQAKKQGKSGYAIFDPLKGSIANGKEVSDNLLVAVTEKKFDLQYQPIVSIDAHRLCSVDVFLRWQHPTLGIINHPDLIKLLEEHHLLATVEDWMIVEVCHQLRLWSELGPELSEFNIRLKVSRSMWFRSEFLPHISQILQSSKIRHHCLAVAISESDLLEDLEHSRTLCRGLRELGVQVSIDHFGIGESSMEYLNDVSIDTLKIDPTITDQLGEDESAARIVRAIIAAGHALGVGVIADRVTTAEQMKTLSDFDFDFIQGAFLSRPVSAEQIKDRLRSSQSIGAGRIL